MSTETLQEMENILKLQKKLHIEEGPASIELRKDRLNRCIAMLKEYNEEIYPLILLADPTSKNSLEYIKINPTNMTPVKHYGYSAQWFLMFIVLCVMYVWFGFKKNEK